jgi:metal-responsive CopG/Arc/MetJ family transcriptional regulator
MRQRGLKMASMARKTATFSVSLPPDMLIEIDRVRKDEHRTRSELIREALRRYVNVRDGTRSVPSSA